MTWNPACSENGPLERELQPNGCVMRRRFLDQNTITANLSFSIKIDLMKLTLFKKPINSSIRAKRWIVPLRIFHGKQRVRLKDGEKF